MRFSEKTWKESSVLITLCSTATLLLNHFFASGVIHKLVFLTAGIGFDVGFTFFLFWFFVCYLRGTEP